MLFKHNSIYEDREEPTSLCNSQSHLNPVYTPSTPPQLAPSITHGQASSNTPIAFQRLIWLRKVRRLLPRVLRPPSTSQHAQPRPGRPPYTLLAMLVPQSAISP